MADRRRRVAVVVQSRMTSTRLPGKVLLPLDGRPLIWQVLERAAAIDGVDVVVAAIPEGDGQGKLVELVSSHPTARVATGPEDDVLGRTILAAEAVEADVVVRISSDCPMFDPRVSGAVLAAFLAVDAPYARTDMEHGFPLGFDTEVVSVDALRAAAAESRDRYEREHVTPFIWRRPDRFPAVHLGARPDRRWWRLTVDTPEDYDLASRVYDELGGDHPHFGYADLVALFTRRPELLEINRDIEQNAYRWGS